MQTPTNQQIKAMQILNQIPGLTETLDQATYDKLYDLLSTEIYQTYEEGMKAGGLMAMNAVLDWEKETMRNVSKLSQLAEYLKNKLFKS